MENIQKYIPFVKPRIDNVDKLAREPTKVHFNTLLACQLIVTKNKDNLLNFYNSNKSE